MASLMKDAAAIEIGRRHPYAVRYGVRTAMAVVVLVVTAFVVRALSSVDLTPVRSVRSTAAGWTDGRTAPSAPSVPGGLGHLALLGLAGLAGVVILAALAVGWRRADVGFRLSSLYWRLRRY
jgi:hypothetical protein